MLSSFVSDVRQTKVYDISFRVPAICEGLGFAEGHGARPSRSPAKRLNYCMTTKSMFDRPQTKRLTLRF